VRARVCGSSRIRDAVRFALLALGVFLALCVSFELAARSLVAQHRISAEVVRWNGRLAEAALAADFAAFDTSRPWLLLVGDSTLALMPPKDLERILGDRLRVANLAVPGLIAGNLERYLRILLEPRPRERWPRAALISFAPHSLVVHPVHRDKLRSGRRDYERILLRQSLPLVSLLRVVWYGLTIQDLFEINESTDEERRAAARAEAEANARPAHGDRRVSAKLVGDVLNQEWPGGRWTVERRSMDGLPAGSAYLADRGVQVLLTVSPVCYDAFLPEDFVLAYRAMVAELRQRARQHAATMSFVSPPALSCDDFRDWSHVNNHGLERWTAKAAAALDGRAAR